MKSSINRALRKHFEVSDELRQLANRLGVDLSEAEARQAKWERLCLLVEGQGVVGLTLSSGSKRWAVITPACCSGVFRYTSFDQAGFIGHGDYATPEDALVQAYQMGFTEWAPPNTLDLVAAGPAWVSA